MIDHVDPKTKEIVSMDGTRLPFDLLIVIPPHKGSELVREAGLGDSGGWLPVDRHKLTLEHKEDVFVVGDATNLPKSKAGSTAHFESEVLAEN